MKLHVKKGDRVVVIRGNNRGVAGEVLSVDVTKARVVVRPATGTKETRVIRKAVRKSQDRPQGGIEEKDRSYHISTVMHEADFQKRGKGPAAQKRPSAG